MDVATFRVFKQHIDDVVQVQGQWIGLVDEEGWPIMDLPPAVKVSAPTSRLASASCEITVPVTDDSPVLAELVATGFDTTGGNTRITPAAGPARFVVVQRPGSRYVFMVTHTVVSGSAGPRLATIHGVDLIEGLAAWPCPSIPVEWSKARFTRYTKDAAEQPYSTPRQLALVQFANAADGYTEKGKAVTVIRKLIQDSLTHVNKAMGWERNPHMVVNMPTGGQLGPEVLIRVNDDSVWDTIAETAKNAGVTVTARLWWPGDAAFRSSVEGVSREKPIQVVDVTFNPNN